MEEPNPIIPPSGYPSSQHKIRARGLVKTYIDRKTTTTAFEGLDFDVVLGEFLAIVGPSGCGKTSLLRTLAGLESATAGTLIIKDAHRPGAPNVAMVFQEHGLFPWMSLRRNIVFLLEQNPAIDASQRETIAASFLERVGLSQFSEYLPHAVSGGMRQRISLARAFAFDSDILLMDEPFIFLDFQTRIVLHKLLISLWEPGKKTVVFVTHDIEEAVMLADRIVVLSAHPGRIKQILTVDLPHPRDPIATRKHADYPRHVDAAMALLT